MFPHITRNLNIIAHQQVLVNKISFLEGRAICLVHTLATPLKALSGLGQLASTVLETAKIVLGVFTLNTHPMFFLTISIKLIDVVGGAFLLPIALLANVIRGVVGATFYPAAMIRETTTQESKLIEGSKPMCPCGYEYKQRKQLIYATQHPFLNGTFVNSYHIEHIFISGPFN